MSQAYLEIGSIDYLIEFIEGVKEVGLLKDISCDKVRSVLSNKDFPIRIPIDLDQVFKIAENPIVRKIFGSQIEKTTIQTILKVANT